MAKFFCPNCKKRGLNILTFALRYFGSDQKWYKTKHSDRYCEVCERSFTEKECIMGEKSKRR